MNLATVQAKRAIRKMRGQAQSVLVEADDGNAYVVKFQNNPQGRRILVNELISAVFLDYLHISAPPVALVRIDQAFIDENPGVGMKLGTRSILPEPGWHFGSRYPGAPGRTKVYDFLPDPILHEVANREHFLAILVFDKWIGNADARQCIFYRANIADTGSIPQSAFVAQMIDQGLAFNGPTWDFPESPIQGAYHRRLVYDTVRSVDDFQPWIDHVVHFPEEVIDRAWRSLPAEWLAGDEDALEQLLESLNRRRKRVPALINDCIAQYIRPATTRTRLAIPCPQTAPERVAAF